jgi:hypothetical protein
VTRSLSWVLAWAFVVLALLTFLILRDHDARLDRIERRLDPTTSAGK